MSLKHILSLSFNVSKGLRPRLHQTALPQVRMMSSVFKEFEKAKERLNSLSEDPGNEAKLKIYALFKQSTVGKVATDRPGMMDFVGRAKWDAWNALGDMTQEEAQKAYIALIDELAGSITETSDAQAEPGKYKYIESTVTDGLRVIKFNRPAKKNAFLKESYDEVVAALKEAADDPATVVTVTTGAGDFYSSGNDLSNFTAIKGDIKEIAKESGVLLNRFVSAFIDFPKPLVAVVNGPAIGVSVTVMGLYDAVYASDRATFHTPFSNLGQSPEGCSSYTFPRIMGPGKAAEMLLFNKKLTAQEAERVGLVTEVLPADTFQQEVMARLQKHAQLPVKSLVYSKALTRDLETKILHEVNDRECDRLVERWTSDDCVNAIMKFFAAKSKM
ncbi:enoyl-CoA delta isomerase 2-like isoform X1 [Amphibalanus amphitrite]|uniref:enoyl-CoA delta isomerase 2-like isoform X1 n=2 Tax=Amphibalanus amphitrite TaxID=1232801 RepID=UPI001C921DE5|nr:enoyl-CoA delta isomerase 2-like isoform X1 [Amphibalanus amphitrite]XP_043197819.1 enoyl-CoA delta isomerase 2-like isoform X1 [Amphibalanus amphitrite]